MERINETDPSVSADLKKLTKEDIARMMLGSPTSGGYGGYADTSTDPGMPSVPKWYFSGGIGTYVNFLQGESSPIVVTENDGLTAFDWIPGNGYWRKLPNIVPIPPAKLPQWQPIVYNVSTQVIKDGLIYELEAGQISSAEDIPGESVKWALVGADKNVLRGLDGTTHFSEAYLSENFNNGVFDSNFSLEYTTSVKHISLNTHDYNSINFIGYRYKSPSIAGNAYVSSFGVKANGEKVKLIGANIGEQQIENITIDVTAYNSVTICWMNNGVSIEKYPEITLKGSEITTVIDYVRETMSKDVNPMFEWLDINDVNAAGFTKYNDPRNRHSGLTGYSKTIGASIEFNFNGSYVSLLGARGSDSGYGEVFIDNISYGSVSFFQEIGDTTLSRVFSASNLTNEPHVLRIVVAGTKLSYSADSYIYVSGIEYGNQQPIKHFDYALNATNFGINPNDQDCTIALQNLIDTLLDGNGGTIFFPKGSYRIEGNIVIGRDKEFSPPIVFIGEGMNSTGKGSYSLGGTIFNLFSIEDKPKFYYRSNGNFETSGITYFLESQNDREIFKVMNTRCRITNNAFISRKRGRLCDNDAIVLGGNLEIQTGIINENGGFQGYGTIISENHFQGVRRGVYGKVYANAVIVKDNSSWTGCGSNLVNGAFIEFDNVDNAGIEENAGGMISGNLIEVPNYDYGIKLGKTIGFMLMGNNIYDPHSETKGAYYLGPEATKNTIVPGFMPVSGSGYGSIKVVKDDSLVKDNRIIWGDIINGDINSFPV